MCSYTCYSDVQIKVKRVAFPCVLDNIIIRLQQYTSLKTLNNYYIQSIVYLI